MIASNTAQSIRNARSVGTVSPDRRYYPAIPTIVAAAAHFLIG
jgi:hypothetical protein